MTRTEIANLLEIMVAAYPNIRIDRQKAKKMVDAWEMAFSDAEAKEIYMAARNHMNTCRYFPTIADIQQKRAKGYMIYSNPVNVSPLPQTNIQQAMIGDGGEQYLDFMDDLLSDLGFGQGIDE